jgi:hypothetical protein
MKFIIDTITPCVSDTQVGNVYHVKGGYGTKAGHMMVLMSITENETCLLLVINKHGKPVGITQYGLSSLDERMPIAFCEGLDALEFRIRSL